MKKNKLILKSQQKFKSKNNDVFIEKFNRIALNVNENKRIESIRSVETYLYGTSNNLR